MNGSRDFENLISCGKALQKETIEMKIDWLYMNDFNNGTGK